MVQPYNRQILCLAFVGGTRRVPLFCGDYQVNENSTSSGVSGLPISGSFLSRADKKAISSSVSGC